MAVNKTDVLSINGADNSGITLVPEREKTSQHCHFKETSLENNHSLQYEPMEEMDYSETEERVISSESEISSINNDPNISIESDLESSVSNEREIIKEDISYQHAASTNDRAEKVEASLVSESEKASQHCHTEETSIYNSFENQPLEHVDYTETDEKVNSSEFVLNLSNSNPNISNGTVLESSASNDRKIIKEDIPNQHTVCTNHGAENAEASLVSESEKASRHCHSEETSIYNSFENEPLKYIDCTETDEKVNSSEFVLNLSNSNPKISNGSVFESLASNDRKIIEEEIPNQHAVCTNDGAEKAEASLVSEIEKASRHCHTEETSIYNSLENEPLDHIDCTETYEKVNSSESVLNLSNSNPNISIGSVLESSTSNDRKFIKEEIPNLHTVWLPTPTIKEEESENGLDPCELNKNDGDDTSEEGSKIKEENDMDIYRKFGASERVASSLDDPVLLSMPSPSLLEHNQNTQWNSPSPNHSSPPRQPPRHSPDVLSAHHSLQPSQLTVTSPVTTYSTTRRYPLRDRKSTVRFNWDVVSESGAYHLAEVSYGENEDSSSRAEDGREPEAIIGMSYDHLNSAENYANSSSDCRLLPLPSNWDQIKDNVMLEPMAFIDFNKPIDLSIKRKEKKNERHKLISTIILTKTVSFIDEKGENKLIKHYKCPNCEYGSNDKRKVTEHTYKHMGLKPYKCPDCPMSFGCTSYLREHRRITHIETPFDCKLCGRKCGKQSALTKHMRVHTGERPFKCNYCDYRSTQLNHVKVHMRQHTGEKPYGCTQCEYKCAYSTLLKKHMLIHTGEKKYVCMLCDFTAKTRESLQSHISKHTGDRPFICHHCSKAYRSRDDVKRHIRYKHLPSQSECFVCKATFKTSSLLKMHMKEHKFSKKKLKNKMSKKVKSK